MRTIGSASGDSKLGCLFWIFLVLAGAVAAAKMIPHEISKLKLRDHMQELASTQQFRNEQFFRKEIDNKARYLGLDIPKDQILVKKYEKRLIMEVKYTVPIDFYFFQWDWQREIHVDEDIYLF